MTRAHTLSIVQINDTHGYLEPHAELVWTAAGPFYKTMGGYARIATLLKRARDENRDGVIALDNGDTFHGTYPAVVSKGEALIPLVNALNLDAMTAHWEFAWGSKHFKEMTGRLNHPMLAINCYDKQTSARVFPASMIVERASLRVGIIGIAATIIDKSMPPHFSEGVRFTLGVDELPAEIARLRIEQGANLIVVLSHFAFTGVSSCLRAVTARISPLWYRTSARSGFRAGTLVSLSVGACGVWAPRAALDFFCVMHRRRWPLAGPKGRSPTAGRSRCVVMVASALNLHLKRRRLYAGRLRPPSRSEKSPVH